MKRTARLACILIAVVTVSCSDNSGLDYMEQLIETNPAKADTLFRTFPVPENRSQRAWYAVLKTQTDYKCYKPAISDSLILTATDYYGTPYNGPKKRRYRAAMAWYTLGCVYTVAQDDVNAIEAYLNAKNLFPDTLIRYYALMEQNLGGSLLRQKKYSDARIVFQDCLDNAIRRQDQHLALNIKYHIAMTYLHVKDYPVADSLFQELISNPRTSSSRLRQSYMSLSKINVYGYKDYGKAMYYINKYLSMAEGANYSGAGFSIKGDIFSETGQYDSAYIYYFKSLDCIEEIHTLCDNYNKLARLSVMSGKTDEALSYIDKYVICYDSIAKIQQANTVNDYLIANSLNSQQQQLTSRFRLRYILFVSCLLFPSILGFLLYRRRILGVVKHCTDEIESLKTSMEEQKNSYEEKLSDSYKYSHDRIYFLYRQKILSNTEVFRSMDSYRILMEKDKGDEPAVLSLEEKLLIQRHLSECFRETIGELSLSYPSANSKDINVLLLSGMGFSNKIIAELSNVSESAIRKKKERLLNKFEPDLFNLLGSRM